MKYNEPLAVTIIFLCLMFALMSCSYLSLARYLESFSFVFTRFPSVQNTTVTSECQLRGYSVTLWKMFKFESLHLRHKIVEQLEK